MAVDGICAVGIGLVSKNPTEVSSVLPRRKAEDLTSSSMVLVVHPLLIILWGLDMKGFACIDESLGS